jgi:hypothetical protein
MTEWAVRVLARLEREAVPRLSDPTPDQFAALIARLEDSGTQAMTRRILAALLLAALAGCVHCERIAPLGPTFCEVP